MKNYTTPSTYKESQSHQKMRQEKKSENPTMTVPGEALSIEEMFKRFSRNQPVAATKREPVFTENASHDDTDLEKIGRSNLIDKQEYSEALGDKMLDLDKKIKHDKEAEAKRKAEAEERDFEEKLAKRQQRDTDKNKPTEPGVTPH